MIRTLIAYASKHGCAEECAKSLSEKIQGQIDLINLKKTNSINLNDYDAVIVGGSIYAGRIQKEVADFCNNHEDMLLTKKLGFYICGMSEGEAGEKQLSSVYPAPLLYKAIAKENFGGKFDFSKINFLEKTIVKKVAKVSSDSSSIHNELIDVFAQKFNDQLL